MKEVADGPQAVIGLSLGSARYVMEASRIVGGNSLVFGNNCEGG